MSKNMTQSFRRKTKEFLRIFRVEKWNLTETLKQLGVERGIFKTWMDNPAFKAEYEECLEERVDWAEGEIVKKIGTNDKMAVVANIFYLKSLSPERFNERIVNQIKYDVSLKDLVSYGEEPGRTRIRSRKEETGKEVKLLGTGDDRSVEHKDSDTN